MKRELWLLFIPLLLAVSGCRPDSRPPVPSAAFPAQRLQPDTDFFSFVRQFPGLLADKLKRNETLHILRDRFGRFCCVRTLHRDSVYVLGNDTFAINSRIAYDTVIDEQHAPFAVKNSELGNLLSAFACDTVRLPVDVNVYDSVEFRQLLFSSTVNDVVHYTRMEFSDYIVPADFIDVQLDTDADLERVGIRHGPMYRRYDIVDREAGNSYYAGFCAKSDRFSDFDTIHYDTLLKGFLVEDFGWGTGFFDIERSLYYLDQHQLKMGAESVTDSGFYTLQPWDENQLTIQWSTAIGHKSGDSLCIQLTYAIMAFPDTDKVTLLRDTVPSTVYCWNKYSGKYEVKKTAATYNDIESLARSRLLSMRRSGTPQQRRLLKNYR